MNQSRWDKRAWLLAFGGGSLCAALDGLVTSWRAKEVLNAIFPHELHGMPTWEILSVVIVFAGLLALPIYLSATARRFYLLWGLIPVWLLSFGISGRDVVQDGISQFQDDIWFLPIMTAASLLLTCGPVSLYRSLHQRKIKRLAAAEKSAQDFKTPQEGVWPPPPRISP